MSVTSSFPDLAAVATAAKSGKELVTLIHTEIELASAWKQYQKAILPSATRKDKMKALSLNPTLSKYAIAYGAYYADDAIAKDVLRKCGINTKTLANANTNVNKLVKYMEVYFSDDAILLRDVEVHKDWMGTRTLALSASSWMEIKTLAEKEATPALAKGSSGQVDRFLVALDSAHYKSAAEPTPEQAQEYLDIIGQLAQAVESYQPKTTTGKPHDDMLELRARLRGLVADERRLMEALLAS